jgi:DNA-binding response OmpR family regulator
VQDGRSEKTREEGIATDRRWLDRSIIRKGGGASPGCRGKEANMARILIVDRDPDAIEACREALSREGHVVEGVRRRQDGLKSILELPPDLLILDVMIEEPDDGLAMAQQLRKHGFSRPILVLSNLGNVTGMAYGASEGVAPVDGFEEKPLSPARLVRRVRELLAGAGPKEV